MFSESSLNDNPPKNSTESTASDPPPIAIPMICSVPRFKDKRFANVVVDRIMEQDEIENDPDCNEMTPPPLKKRKLNNSADVLPPNIPSESPVIECEAATQSVESPTTKNPFVLDPPVVEQVTTMDVVVDSEMTVSEEESEQKQDEEKKEEEDDSHSITVPTDAIPENAENHMIASHREFADNLSIALSSNKQNGWNQIYSPLSLQSAMTTAMCGARGNTLTQMMQVLYPKVVVDDIEDIQSICDLAKELNTTIMQLCSNYKEEIEDGTVVYIANKLWINKTFHILYTFDEATDLYALGAFDRSDGVKSAQMINQWVGDKTKNQINKIVDAEMMGKSDLLITSAIHFSGIFAVPLVFNKEDINENVPFYSDRERSKKIGTVTMMCSKVERVFAERVNGIWDVVKLPYLNSSLFLLLVIKNHGENEDKSKQSPNAKDLMNMVNQSGTFIEEKCDLWVPQFKAEGDLHLKEVLMSMGVSHAFEQGDADFSGIDGSTNLCLANVIHKAVIDVDEDMTGVKEKEVGNSETKLDEKVSAKHICFNHPFTFYVVDEFRSTLLLQGEFNGN